MKNPFGALVEWRHRKLDEKMRHDQGRAKHVGVVDAEFHQRREQLQGLMDQRRVELERDAAAALLEDPLLVREDTGVKLRQALALLAQDPAVRAIGEAGLILRGELRPYTSTPENAFLEKLQIMSSAQSLEFRSLALAVDSAALNGARVAIIHDLLPAGQRSDYLDTVTAIVVGLEQTERGLRARMDRPRKP